MINVLLSYPRSGNHLVRFFIELITETQTNGCKYNDHDIPIYKNVFDSEIPFNINEESKLIKYNKYHNSNEIDDTIDQLILIVRNPREVLLRQCDYKMTFSGTWCSFDHYFRGIDFYNNATCNKKLFYYEDIITNKKEFIVELYDFLGHNNPEKLKYILDNIDSLYTLSSNGKNRAWGGINSNSLNYYYPKLDSETKIVFDKYITEKLSDEKYKFLASKFKIEL